MVWQEKIISRLSISNLTTKIVIDKTGALNHPDFQHYLANEQVSYAIGNSHSEILQALKDKKNLIITNLKSLPSHIKSRNEVIEFGYNLLPINADHAIISTLPLDDIINLLYATDKEKIKYIDASNCKTIIVKGEKYRYLLKCKEIEAQLNNYSASGSNYSDILKSGVLWGERLYYGYKADFWPSLKDIKSFDDTVIPFWQSNDIKNAFYESAANLKTVDKICPYIKGTNRKKFALICFDGMGVAEWFLFKEQLKGFKFHERFLFSLIPSITETSRKAIFSGNYEKSINFQVSSDEKGFSEFFNQGSAKFFRDKDTINEQQLLGINQAGIIFNFFDEIGHNTVFPHDASSKELYYNNILSYLSRSQVLKKITLIRDLGYKLFFCSDHGNVLSRGNGRQIDKYLVDKKSKRATIAKPSQLLDNLDADIFNIPFITEKVAVCAKGREHFGTQDEPAITHGGISSEEMIVPFVEVIN